MRIVSGVTASQALLDAAVEAKADLVRAIGGQIIHKESTHHLHEGRTGITPHLASTGG